MDDYFKAMMVEEVKDMADSLVFHSIKAFTLNQKLDFMLYDLFLEIREHFGVDEAHFMHSYNEEGIDINLFISEPKYKSISFKIRFDNLLHLNLEEFLSKYDDAFKF